VGINAAVRFLLVNESQPDFAPDESAGLARSAASGATYKTGVTVQFDLYCRPTETPLAG
jgi:hypothetical protein